MNVGPFEAEVHPGWDSPAIREALARLPGLLAGGEVVQDGRNRIVRCRLGAPPDAPEVVVKVFPGSGGLLRRWGLRPGKARRAWDAACAFARAGVGTPAPVAMLEERRGRTLAAGYLVTIYHPDLISLKDALHHLYRHHPYSADLMALLQAVADAVRAMHDAGWLHYDLGNQNILLPRSAPPSGRDILFVDLNRARCQTPTWRRIGRDLSRLHLPSDLRRILYEMILDGPRPKALRRWEAWYRRAFAWHTRTRRWRHPIRERRLARTSEEPADRDLWIWDEASGQAISVWTSSDRRRLHDPADGVRMARACLSAAAPLRAAYRDCLARAYREPVPWAGRVSLAVQMRPDTRDRELAHLSELGPVPVVVRAYHHEGRDGADACIEGIRRLADAGHPVTLALVQDRAAVRNPDAWTSFAGHLLRQTAPHLRGVELGHAVSRVKWGFWSLAEYRRWCAASLPLREAYSHLTWAGPATIDFEPHRTLGFLRAVPPGMRFDALSQHLYVDRRGAPENRQGRFSTLEKVAWFRALARISPACNDRLILSEFNWPLEGTGIHSPVCSPYLYAGQTVDTNVGEEEAARFLVRYLLITLCSGLAEQAVFWRLAARGYGLLDDTDPANWRARPGWDAFRDLVRHLGTATFLHRPDTPPGVEGFVFEQNGRYHWVLYAHPEPVRFKPHVTWTQARYLPGGPVTVPVGPLHLDGTPLLLKDTQPAPRAIPLRSGSFA